MHSSMHCMLPARISVLLALALIFVLSCSNAGTGSITLNQQQPASIQPNALPPLPIDLPATRAAQAIDVTTQRGQDAVTTTAGCSPDGADSLLISAGASGLEYAMYQFSPGAGTLSSVVAAIDVSAGSQVWIGIANYGSFKWDLQGPYPSAGASQFDNLGSGDYVNAGGNSYFIALAYDATSVSVSSVEFSVEVTPATFNISGMVTDSAGPGVLPGATLTLSPGGATAITTVNGSYQFSGLAAGTYTVTPSLTGYTFLPASRQVTVGPNASGIDFVGTAEVPAVTYTADIAPIMENYCTGCHDANSPAGGIPLTTYSEVKSMSSLCNSDIKSDAMPPGSNKLSAAEKQKFQDWIDAGKPQ